jgi:hypothetical protein
MPPADEPPALPEVLPEAPLPEVPELPDAPLVLLSRAAPELPVVEGVFDFLAAFFSDAASVPVVPDAPEEVAPAPDDCCACTMSFACCSTAAAFAGSVLVVTPLEEDCADAMPASDINEMKRAKDIFFMLTSMGIVNYRL